MLYDVLKRISDSSNYLLLRYYQKSCFSFKLHFANERNDVILLLNTGKKMQ